MPPGVLFASRFSQRKSAAVVANSNAISPRSWGRAHKITAAVCEPIVPGRCFAGLPRSPTRSMTLDMDRFARSMRRPPAGRVVIGVEADIVPVTLAEFPAATLVRDDAAMVDVMNALELIALGRPAPDLPIHISGTAFQARVWAALTKIPSGETHTYSEIAESIGEPKAVRAVANACGANPTALAVPCHRVIRTDGSLGGYHWGLGVKESLLAAESTIS
jgi:O-6-methylguanine DNA methyltransferase